MRKWIYERYPIFISALIVLVILGCQSYIQVSENIPSKRDRCLSYLRIDAARNATDADDAMLEGLEGNDMERMKIAIDFIIADCRLYLAQMGILIVDE